MPTKRTPVTQSKIPAALSNQVDELENRITALEIKTDYAHDSLSKIETSHDSMQAHIANFNVALVELKSSVARLNSFEGDLRLLRDKFLGFEQKLASLDQIRGLLWALLLAVLPGAASILSEIVRFLMSKGIV